MRGTCRALALVLALTCALLAGTTFSTQDRAYAAPLLLVPAAAAALPFSIVSAGVGGGAMLLGTGGALASAAITAAAALGLPTAVRALATWAASTPSTFGDPPAAVADGKVYTWDSPAGASGPSASRDNCIGSTHCRPMSLSYTAGGVVTAGLTLVPAVSNGSAFLDIACTSVAASTAGSSIRVFVGFYNGFSGTGTMVTGCTSGTFRFGWESSPSSTLGSGTFTGTATAPAPGPAPAGSGTAPLVVQPYTDCRTAAGVVTRVLGPAASTTRATTSVGLTYPGCAGGSSVAGRGATITGTGGSVIGSAGPTPAGATGLGAAATPWVPPAVPSTYPECVDQSCVMTLTRTGPDGRTTACGQSDSCAAFGPLVQRFPATGTSATTGPRVGSDGASYSCKFGPYAMAIAECTVIPGAGTAVGTEPSTANCIRDGISFNPLSWVTEPVKCALQDAFGIKPATQARVDITRARLASVPPFSLIGAVGAWLAPFGSLGQSCPTWAVKVGSRTTPILCGQGYAQRMNDNRTLFGVAMTLTMLGPFAWRIWHAAIPVVKVQRGS